MRYEETGQIQTLHCNCGSVWTFKDGGLEFKAGKYKPKEWVGLTDEELRQICGSVPAMREAVREAEAKLKEKNHV